MKVNILSLIAFMFILIFLILFSNSYVINAASESNGTMVVEVNLLGFGNVSETPDVSIEVPDYIFLGNITKDNPVSNESNKVYINNSGKVNVTITPQLADSEEEIFKWLFFKRIIEDPWQKIGNYSLNIDKPAAGNRVRSKYCYMKLDLTDFNGNITEDVIGHQTNIIFYAMAAQ